MSDGKSEKCSPEDCDTDSTLAPDDDNSNKHWVEKLFKPAFGFTIDELYQPKEQPKPSVFEQYARRIRPIDTEAIKNVYERVWLISRLEEQDLAEKTTPLDACGQRCQETQTSISDFDAGSLDCIWTPAEIKVLRKVFHTAQEENRKIKVEVDEAERRSSYYQAKYKHLSETWESVNKESLEAIAANRRLHILNQSLQEQTREAEKKLKAMHETMAEEIETRQKLEKEMAEYRKGYNLEKVYRQRREREVEKLKTEQVRTNQIIEDKFQVKYQGDIVRLRKKLEEVQEELNEEKKAHKKTKIGLDHLRKHFACLPYAEDISQTSMVTDNQLTKLTYS